MKLEARREAEKASRSFNLFVIPSWWPHRCNKLAGCFFVEWVSAVAAMHPEWQIGVSLWGQGDRRITKDHLSPLCWMFPLRLKPTEPNVTYYYSHAWAIRGFKHQESIGHVIDCNRNNFSDFCIDLGKRAGKEYRFVPVDMIHAHACFPAGAAAQAVSELNNVPYVITEHMGPFPLPTYA